MMRPNLVEVEATALWRAFSATQRCLARGWYGEADKAMHTVRMVGELTEIPSVAKASERMLETLHRMRTQPSAVTMPESRGDAASQAAEQPL